MLLDTQYRMAAPIAEFPSLAFYGGKLGTAVRPLGSLGGARQTTDAPLLCWPASRADPPGGGAATDGESESAAFVPVAPKPVAPQALVPVAFVDHRSCGPVFKWGDLEAPDAQGSKTNETEAWIVAHLVARLEA